VPSRAPSSRRIPPSGLFSQFPQAAFRYERASRRSLPTRLSPRNFECPVVQAALEGTASSFGSRQLELTESIEKDSFGLRIGTRLRERGRAKQQGSLLPFLPRQKVLARSTFLARRLDRTLTRHNTPFCLWRGRQAWSWSHRSLAPSSVTGLAILPQSTGRNPTSTRPAPTCFRLWPPRTRPPSNLSSRRPPHQAAPATSDLLSCCGRGKRTAAVPLRAGSGRRPRTRIWGQDTNCQQWRPTTTTCNTTPGTPLP
jgi:hypothetical protein